MVRVPRSALRQDGPVATRAVDVTASSAGDAHAAIRSLRLGAGGDPTFRQWDAGMARAMHTPFGPGTVAFGVDGDRVLAEAWGPGREWLVDRVPTMLGLHDDGTGFAPVHPLVRRLHRAHPGLRIGASGIVWQELIHTIVAQKVTTFEANRSWARLVWRFGEPAPGPLPLRLPPTPERLATLGYAAFHPFGIERKRADAILLASRHARALEVAATMTPQDARARIAAVRGLGPWTADTVVIRCHGDPDATLRGDYHLPSIITWALAQQRRGTDEEMLELLEPFRPHRWRVARLLMMGHGGPPRHGPRLAPRNIEHF